MATMCKYGNCCEYETSISLNGCGYRLRFCSWLHAAGGALGHASYAQRGTCPEAYDLIANQEWRKRRKTNDRKQTLKKENVMSDLTEQDKQYIETASVFDLRAALDLARAADDRNYAYALAKEILRREASESACPS